MCGCTVSEKSADTTAAMNPPVATPGAGATPVAADSTAASTGATSTPATQPTPALRVEVDVSARKLYLYENGNRIETHSVAVGSTKWPTKTGEWTIKQVVFNPEWTPPDESWAEEREPREPGDPKNPLGRAQLVYDPPRSIHGTNQPTSIGQAVSHGSIRMNNAEILALGKRLMAATGVGKDEAWYREAETKRSVKQIIDLPTPIPIKVF